MGKTVLLTALEVRDLFRHIEDLFVVNFSADLYFWLRDVQRACKGTYDDLLAKQNAFATEIKGKLDVGEITEKDGLVLLNKELHPYAIKGISVVFPDNAPTAAQLQREARNWSAMEDPPRMLPSRAFKTVETLLELLATIPSDTPSNEEISVE